MKNVLTAAVISTMAMTTMAHGIPSAPKWFAHGDIREDGAVIFGQRITPTKDLLILLEDNGQSMPAIVSYDSKDIDACEPETASTIKVADIDVAMRTICNPRSMLRMPVSEVGQKVFYEKVIHNRDDQIQMDGKTIHTMDEDTTQHYLNTVLQMKMTR